MFDKELRLVVASVALFVAMPLTFAQTPGTSGPANPKEIGKPGTSANSGAGTSGALNSSDVKGAKVNAERNPIDKKRTSTVKEKRVGKKAVHTAASAP